MKNAIVAALALGLMISLAALFLQSRQHQERLARQEQATAAVQSRYDQLQLETNRLRQAEAKRQFARAALSRARSLAPRYASLDRVTGYQPKPATTAKK